MKILILCTGNSCRSQMGQAFMKSYDKELKVFSAGTEPSSTVHPLAINVMDELGFDLSNYKPESVNQYLNIDFDYLITVCGGAKESCPNFTGKVKHRIHIGFNDPAEAKGSNAFILSEFRRIRDEINADFKQYYQKIISCDE